MQNKIRNNMSLIKIDDIEIYYEVHGDGEPLVFIHGLGSSSAGWKYQLEYFSKHYQVILVDVRGHGQSSITNNQYSIKQFASDIAKLMSRLEIEQYHIVGLSMGGAISFQMALDVPDSIKSMTIVNSWPDFTLQNVKEKLGMAFVYVLVKLFGLKSIVDKVAESLYPNNQNPALFDEFSQQFLANDKNSFLNARMALTRWSIMSELAKIRCPTLILAADQDYTSVAFKEKFTKLIAKAKILIVPNSHHALPVEKPDEFNPYLLDFLKSVG